MKKITEVVIRVIVGTVKTTGKTTTALRILELVCQTGIPTGLTSGRYDGENSDPVTGLAKPRSYARQGMTIATTASPLELGTAKYDPIRPTGIDTTLGEAALQEVVGWLGPQEQGTITIPGVIHPELFKKKWWSFILGGWKIKSWFSPARCICWQPEARKHGYPGSCSCTIREPGFLLLPPFHCISSRLIPFTRNFCNKAGSIYRLMLTSRNCWKQPAAE